MEDKEIWSLIRQTWSALGPHYQPVIERIVEQSELDVRVWNVLLAALAIDPEEISPAYLMVRSPYTSADHYLGRLEAATIAGYMTEVAQGKFRLSDRGHSKVEQFMRAARQAMAEVDPLTEEKSQRLASLLARLVENCLRLPSPPNKWSLKRSYALMPAMEPCLPHVEQSFTCLAAYRNDSHLGAWRESGLTATALEALTLLWRDEVRSLGEIVEELEHRGHPWQIYSDALLELRDRGYVRGDRDDLRLTDDGQEFRQQVEQETDQYFYAPWDCLEPPEKSELGELLHELQEGLAGEEIGS